MGKGGLVNYNRSNFFLVQIWLAVYLITYTAVRGHTQMHLSFYDEPLGINCVISQSSVLSYYNHQTPQATKTCFITLLSLDMFQILPVW